MELYTGMQPVSCIIMCTRYWIIFKLKHTVKHEVTAVAILKLSFIVWEPYGIDSLARSIHRSRQGVVWILLVGTSPWI